MPSQHGLLPRHHLNSENVSVRGKTNPWRRKEKDMEEEERAEEEEEEEEGEEGEEGKIYVREEKKRRN